VRPTRFAADLEGRLREAIGVLELLLGPPQIRGRNTLLGDFLCRAEQTSKVDGFARGGGSERVGGGGTSNPTLVMVEARATDVCGKCDHGMALQDGRLVQCRQCGGSGRRWADPVAHAVASLVDELTAVCKSVQVIDRRRAVLVTAATESRGRQTSLQGVCEACGGVVSGVGEDRLKRSVCPPCYSKWREYRATHPSTDDPGADFQRFLVHRRVELAEAAESAAITRIREMDKPMGRVG